MANLLGRVIGWNNNESIKIEHSLSSSYCSIVSFIYEKSSSTSLFQLDKQSTNLLYLFSIKS